MMTFIGIILILVGIGLDSITTTLGKRMMQ
jgi:hypothetical protein